MNPLARKRWARFRRHRRGFWSLVLMVALYTISLFSELICNDRPLYVRFDGRHYFPALFFYPDDVFTGSGRSTRPDYKVIRRSEAFAADPENWMLFAPVPFGPFEIISPESLAEEAYAEVVMRSAPRVGNVNVDVYWKVVRSQSADWIRPMSGAGLDAAWSFPDKISGAVALRLANEAAPAVSAILTNRLNSGLVAEVRMTAFMPRSQPPRDVRITFREVSLDGEQEHVVRFRRDLAVVPHPDAFWSELSGDEQGAISGIAASAFEGKAAGGSIMLAGVEHRAEVRVHDVQWPFRPVPGHWFGIDNAGRDVLARILYGLRTSMTFGLLLVGFSMGFGILMGALQGYHGGRIDLVGQRVIEVWSTIPFLYVMILLGSMYGRSFSLLLFCYGIFNWIGISYYVRAEFLRLRHAPFVEAARCLGLSTPTIMFRHILPNALTPIITFFPFSLVGAIGSLAILDYLGFGLPPPTPSWGELLQQAQSFRWAWWLILYPSVSLFGVMLLGVFMGEGVRDAYDPKPVMRME